MVTVPFPFEHLRIDPIDVSAAFKRARAFGDRITVGAMLLTGNMLSRTARYAAEHRSGLTATLAGVLGGIAGVSLIKGGLDINFSANCRELAAVATNTTRAGAPGGTLNTLASGALPAAGAVLLGGTSMAMRHGKRVAEETRLEPGLSTLPYSAARHTPRGCSNPFTQTSADFLARRGSHDLRTQVFERRLMGEHPAPTYTPHIYTSHYSDFSNTHPKLAQVYIEALDRDVSALVGDGPPPVVPLPYRNAGQLDNLNAMLSAN